MVTVGLDEVGRGCWAGPLVAGAVVLDGFIPGLRDSKKLSKPQRERLAVKIETEALAIGLGWVDAATIDKVGISTAVKLAMERALASITYEYEKIIIDGNINYLAAVKGLSSHKVEAVVRADESVPAVSAASIVAKVARDNYMAALSGKYAPYQFGKHAGYGTALHLELLRQYGVSDLHRRSFKPVRMLLPSQARVPRIQ